MRTVYRNGVVHASGPTPPTALLVQDGLIAWLGADEDAPTDVDEVVDLDGGLVTPGFVDANVHALETGLTAASVELSGASSLTEALDLLAAADDVHGVVVAAGWDETGWPDGRTPTPEEVARAVAGRQAYVVRADGRSAVVTAELADRAGCRDRSGWSDGLVFGSAHAAARAAVRTGDPERRAAFVRLGLWALAASGVVSVHEHSSPELDTREGLAEMLAESADPRSGMPEMVGYRMELCEDADDARRIAEEVPGLAGIGTPPVDGSLETRSAALRMPYADAGGEARGELALTAEQIANHVGAATRAGLQAVVPVVGDRAMAEVLLGFQAAADVEGVPAIRGARHRLENAAMIDTPALARILLMGLTVGVQPLLDVASGRRRERYARRLGPARVAGLSPYADLVGAGIPVAFGSGSPMGPVEPWAAVRAAAVRQEPSQRLSPQAAFLAHTVGGWSAAGRTGCGEVIPGAPASFAVWRLPSGRVVGTERLGADGRAGVNLGVLPDLSDAVALPVCVCTVRDGVVLFRETD